MSHGERDGTGVKSEDGKIGDEDRAGGFTGYIRSTKVNRIIVSRNASCGAVMSIPHVVRLKILGYSHTGQEAACYRL